MKRASAARRRSAAAPALAGAVPAASPSPLEEPARPGDPGSLVVNEIFHSIQGESTWAGWPCVFVRLTACNLRCDWCDTEYAFSEGVRRPVDQVVREALGFGCPLVEITGGEPLLQEGVYALMERLLAAGRRVLLETGGAVSTERVPEGVHVILDVKCPGSGMHERNDWRNLDRLRPGDEVKFVLADRADYEWARDLVRERALDRRAPLHFSSVWGRLEPRLLAEWILSDRLPVRLNLQVHKVLWGAAARGV
jgi:7-carboxy-7-deazaguanine synthase